MFDPFINLRLRVKAMIRRRQLDRDLEEELSFHLSLREASYQGSGAAPDEAHAAARREFGNITALQEACRDMWTFVSIENLWQDLRFAVRTLRKEPGFTAMAVLSLALGMGANTAVFTIVNDLLLKTIPVEDPANLVSFGKAEGSGVQGGLSGSIDIFPYEFYQRLANRGDVFQGICTYGSFPIALHVRQSGSQGPAGQANGALSNQTGTARGCRICNGCGHRRARRDSKHRVSVAFTEHLRTAQRNTGRYLDVSKTPDLLVCEVIERPPTLNPRPPASA